MGSSASTELNDLHVRLLWQRSIEDVSTPDDVRILGGHDLFKHKTAQLSKTLAAQSFAPGDSISKRTVDSTDNDCTTVALMPLPVFEQPLMALALKVHQRAFESRQLVRDAVLSDALNIHADESECPSEIEGEQSALLAQPDPTLGPALQTMPPSFRQWLAQYTRVSKGSLVELRVLWVFYMVTGGSASHRVSLQTFKAWIAASGFSIRQATTGNGRLRIRGIVVRW